MPGISCYEVQDGDTLESLAFSATSLMRDVGELHFHNSHALWGHTRLFKGMQLRLPAPACVPDHSVRAKALICHTVLDGDTVQSIADKFDTSPERISSLNRRLLGPIDYFNPGMRIHVPHPNPIPDPTLPCVPDEHGLWTCFTVGGDVPVSEGMDIWSIAILNNANPWRICELNRIDCSNASRPWISGVPVPVLIYPGTTLMVAQTECTPHPGEYTCYTMPYDPTIPPEQQWPLPDSDWANPRYFTQTGLTVGQDRVADPLQFFDAYLNLNKPYFADIDPFGVTCVTNKSAMSSCGWFPNMHVKIPTKSPCVGADPNACVTIDETRAQKMADLAKCKAHQYQNCTWSDNMEWMALWWAPTGGTLQGVGPLFWVPGRGAPPNFVCKQRCDSDVCLQET
jgi:hypothetical protein